jgi:DNA-binding response OmpR family regulator
MNLKSLLLSSDEKIVRVLRRTLGDLEIEVEHCTSAEKALRFLTRERFEAIIVDCSEAGAPQVLRGARTAACNKRAVAVAILDETAGLRSAFDNGAHFTLHKPVSAERAKSSFRAARALMKKERRRNERIPVKIPLEMVNAESDARIKVDTIDIGEGGLAISLPKKTRRLGRWKLLFTLPGANSRLEIPAEFAWEGTGTQVGLRFVDASPQAMGQLREWLKQNSPQAEIDDPPVRCQLTDLTLHGCYVESASPFPVSTRLTLSMKAAGIEIKTEGMVRVMHADKGMGVEFTHGFPEETEQIEKFLACLGQNQDAQPELFVEPEALETDVAPKSAGSTELDDPLINLFRNHAELGVESFQAELRKQRGMAAAAGV